MSDSSPTHWLKDSGENFHCMPDKPICVKKDVIGNSILTEVQSMPIIDIELPDGDERKIKQWFLEKKEPKNGREYYQLSATIIEAPDKLPKTIPISYFQPEKWAVDKNTLRNIIDALQAGLEHTRSTLAEHDSSLGRTTRKNKSWAETIESDIRAIEKSIKDLKLVEVENTTTYK